MHVGVGESGSIGALTFRVWQGQDLIEQGRHVRVFVVVNRTSMCLSSYGLPLCEQCGERMSDATKTAIYEALSTCLDDANEQVRASAAACLGALAPFASDSMAESMADEALEPAAGSLLHARLVTLSGVAR